MYSCPWDFCFLVLHPNIAFLCESRKEQSDGIAIDTKSIASSALPVGLCRRQKGETREEGGHALRGVRTQLVTKKATCSVAFFSAYVSNGAVRRGRNFCTRCICQGLCAHACNHFCKGGSSCIPCTFPQCPDFPQ